jgi:hypothetical protein
MSNPCSRRLAATLSLVGALLCTSFARASAPRLPVDMVDALGQHVSVNGAANAPTVLFFMSKRAKDASAAFARTVDERLLDRPVESIGIVDMRKYSGMLKGLASSYLRRSAEESKIKRRERRQAAGVDASPAAVDRWHLVGDFDGSLFSRFGVEADPAQPLAFVVDGSGAVRGPFHDVDPVVQALAEAKGSASAAAR